MEQQSAFGQKNPIKDEMYFYGRGIETKEILGHLSNNQSVFLIGSRKIGKTSLITHLLREDVQQLQGMLAKRHLFVYIDFNDPHYQSPNNLWDDVVGEIGLSLSAQRMREESQEKQENKATPLSEEDSEHNDKIEGKKPAGYSHGKIIRFMENATKKHQVTIVMDGFEYITKKETFGLEFYNQLKQLAGQIGNLSYLVASSKNFSQAYQEDDDLQAASLSEIFTTIQLGLLKKREAMAFLKQENSHAIDMDRKVAEWGYEVTGGHPYLLQVIGHHLDSLSIKTSEQLKAHRDEIMNNTMDECNVFFTHLLEGLSTEEREGLLALIRFKPVGNMIDLLARKSLVRDRKSQKVFAELFDRFLHEFWGDFAEDNPAKIQIQFRQKVFFAGIIGSLFSIFMGTFALLSSILVLGTFLFGFGILCFLIVFMFFKDESYSPQRVAKS